MCCKILHDNFQYAFEDDNRSETFHEIEIKNLDREYKYSEFAENSILKIKLDEVKQKTKDNIIKEIEEIENIWKRKDREVEVVLDQLKVQNEKNQQLQGVIDTFEGGNQKIKDTIERTSKHLASALGE